MGEHLCRRPCKAIPNPSQTSQSHAGEIGFSTYSAAEIRRTSPPGARCQVGARQFDEFDRHRLTGSTERTDVGGERRRNVHPGAGRQLFACRVGKSNGRSSYGGTGVPRQSSDDWREYCEWVARGKWSGMSPLRGRVRVSRRPRANSTRRDWPAEQDAPVSFICLPSSGGPLPAVRPGSLETYHKLAIITTGCYCNHENQPENRPGGEGGSHMVVLRVFPAADSAGTLTLRS